MPTVAMLSLLTFLAVPPAPASSGGSDETSSNPPAQPVKPGLHQSKFTPKQVALTQVPAGLTFLAGKYATTFYGFIEADSIHDSTRSFVDLAGMNPIARPGTLGGDNGRTMFGIRNSRFGFHIQAPELAGIDPTGWLEMDFLGNQPGSPPKQNGFAEAPFWNNPTFRVRHFLLKMNNDIVTLAFGQTWELVGWQAQFQPNTVDIQGVPGELYSRTPQIRASHEFHLGGTTIEVAAAALRPPQMDAVMPDFQGGLKLSIDGWKGVQTVGATGTMIAPAAIGLSGGLRKYVLPTSTGSASVNGWVGAADVMIPVIPSSTRKAWTLTVLGEVVDGSGDADLYTGLNGGMVVGSPLGYPGGAAAYAKVADIDPGLAGWSNATGSLITQDWASLMVSAQLYLPPEGRLWLAGAYSNTLSDNTGELGSAASSFWHETWWDANLFCDVTPAVRLGLEYAQFTQTYGDGVVAPDHRVQMSAFFIF